MADYNDLLQKKKEKPPKTNSPQVEDEDFALD